MTGFAPSLTQELVDQIHQWIDDDVETSDQAELRELLTLAEHEDEAGAAARRELADRFSGFLEFGTAGLRGAMAAGPARMNRAVVIRAAWGLGSYLTQSFRQAGLTGRPLVVIGHDARYRSKDFAHDSAAVLTALGIDVKLYDGPRPTPTLAFAVRALHADAGVMVTASHNPAADNGYKVYLGGRVVTDAGQGAQIVPPYDANIASHIAQAPPARLVERAPDGWELIGDGLVNQYLSAIPRDVAAGPLRVTATAMHGVGGKLLLAALERAGFTQVELVPEQAEPDPDFPTVPFPNPEEPGALDLAFTLADTTLADIVIAVDPDADRCAVGIPDPYLQGKWRALHGDELGALLGADAIARLAQPRASDPDQQVRVANSIVSSRLLGQIAQHHGVDYQPTLTGFKWISRVPGLIFGYEEAIGYCIDPEHVRDKDGISAAVAIARIASELKAQGRSIMDALDDLAREHGLYLSSQANRRYARRADLVAATHSLLAHPPAELGGSPVVDVTDLEQGMDGLPPTTGVRILAEDGTRVIVRPSGTEPKVKAYLEVIEQVSQDASSHELGRARHHAAQRLRDLAAQVLP